MPDNSSDQAQPLLQDDTGHIASYGGEANVESQRLSTFAKNLSARDAYAVLISIIIGSGVFTSPGSIDSNVPSPGVGLLVWLVGGLLAWTGAATMAELGTAIPGEGGIQPYLTRAYGEVFGFLAAWTWIVALMPATLAILSIAFVDTISSFAGVTGGSHMWAHKGFSIMVLFVVTGANCISTKTSTRLGSFFVVIKLLSIALLVLAGISVVGVYSAQSHHDIGGGDWHSRGWFGPRDTVQRDGTKIDWTTLGQWQRLGHYSAALYGALWAYSGWDKANYVAAELSSPSQQLPLSINTAIPTIILSYVLSNAVYYILLPWSVVSTTDSVAVTAIMRVLGSAAAIVAVVMICLVIAGSLLGNSFVTGRMTVSAANKSWLPEDLGVVGRVGRKRNVTGTSNSDVLAPRDTPINALVLSAIISAIYILVGDFRVLLTFNGLGEYTFFLLAVLGNVILRWKEPDLPRPYKPFIGVPILFAVICAFMVVRGAIFAPVPAAILIGIWSLGYGFYLAMKRSVERA
ncbi:amino acid transporter [Pseudovirgaria hyperparasitica]|uniref:Amino acid transporter n=1 Tax=Pseudovirgaria hyperparasitica TaxID=470096 RepID=A0A6A6W0K0_9PEZI|nr:amino acid transporter [Pseudovirgaria hyperparasitica]KAF2756432.1 amino acid transporter [Pseudovirgaria hyperparasitica]